MKIKMMYDGKRSMRVVTLDVEEEEFAAMVEKDYALRLKSASPDEEVKPRKPMEIIDEMNLLEIKSWRKLNEKLDAYHAPNYKYEDEELSSDFADCIPDFTQLNEMKEREAYEELCQKIKNLLKPKQADMVISICLDGMSVKEYAKKIADKPNNVTKRYCRVKEILRGILQNN